MVTTGIYSLSVNPPAYDKTKTTGTAQCSTGQPIDFWQAQTIPYPMNLVGGNMVTPTYTYNNGTTTNTTTNTTTDETTDAASNGVDKNLLPQEGDTEEVKAQKAQDMAYAIEDLLKGNPSSSNVQLVDRYFSSIIATKDADYVQKFLDVAKDANININGDNVSSLFGAYTKAVSNNSMSVFDNKPAQETSESATLSWLKKFQSVSSDTDYQNAYSDFAGVQKSDIQNNMDYRTEFWNPMTGGVLFGGGLLARKVGTSVAKSMTEGPRIEKAVSGMLKRYVKADDAGATLEDAIKTVARKGSKLKPEDLTKFLKDGADADKVAEEASKVVSKVAKTVSKGGKLSKLIKVGGAVAVVAGLVSLTGSLFGWWGKKDEGSKFANNIPL